MVLKFSTDEMLTSFAKVQSISGSVKLFWQIRTIKSKHFLLDNKCLLKINIKTI